MSAVVVFLLEDNEFEQGRKLEKIGPVTVSRPRLYARTPRIQNLGETKVAWEKRYFFYFLGEIFFIKRHVHVPTCTWGMWSENMEC